MCNYSGSHFGASYEDAACIDGYLWDLDSDDGDGLTSGGDIPCPMCNTNLYLDSAKEEAENTSWGSSMTYLYSGAMILENALICAEKNNKLAFEEWKKNNPIVIVLDWPDRELVFARMAKPEYIVEKVICF